MLRANRKLFRAISDLLGHDARCLIGCCANACLFAGPQCNLRNVGEPVKAMIAFVSVGPEFALTVE
jgi:hypothetical protein